MKIGSQVRFSGGYGSDTFEVVAISGVNVGIRALTNTATLAVGECMIVPARDLWVYRA